MRLFLYCVSWNKKIKVFDDVVAISVFVVAREESQMNGTTEWIALALIKNRLNDKCMFNKNKRIRCSTNNNQQHATCVFCLSHWTRPKKEKWMNEWPHEKWLLMKFQTYCVLIVFFGHCFSLFSINTHNFCASLTRQYSTTVYYLWPIPSRSHFKMSTYHGTCIGSKVFSAIKLL